MTSTTDPSTIPGVVDAVRHGFERGRTRPLEWREAQLDALLRLLDTGGDELIEAMQADLDKPAAEAQSTDVSLPTTEIRHLRKHLRSWAAPRKAALRLRDRPGRAHVRPEPLGLSLVIAPWNYPVYLLLAPMATSIAAGNAVVAKPSEITSHTSTVLTRLVQTHLDPEAVAVVEGGPEVSEALLAQRFDHIFFTGSTAVGRIVARAAAEHLTPTILELGGKSPVIVGRDADLEVAATRIAWGKGLNAGQTCIAPDYVLVERSRRDELVERLAGAFGDFYGDDPLRSDDFGSIVSDRHVERLRGLLDDHGGTVALGGTVDAERRRIEPTIVVDPDPESSLMQEEIFGPVLPVLTVADEKQAATFVRARPSPLALYVFSDDSEITDEIVETCPAGGVCINHTLLHFVVPSLPFGGVGASGHGRYHGREGFDALSNLTPVLDKPTRPDVRLLYPPYTKLKAKLLETFS